MTAHVVGGPTSQGQKPFQWSERWAGFEHRGMPTGPYEFQFEAMAASELPFAGHACEAGAAAS